MLELANANADELPICFVYDNYVYTIVVQTYEVLISPKTDTLTADEIDAIIDIKKQGPISFGIVQSFSDKKDAEAWADAMNNNYWVVDGVPEAMFDKICEIFESKSISFTIDPETYQYVLKVRVYTSIQNELHGASLQCH